MAGSSYKDYYALLGVPRTADQSTITKAYKKLAKKYHPDLNPGDARAEEKFKDINEAYEVLKDPKKRQYYDQLGPDWEKAQHFGGFGGGQGGFGGFDGQNVRFTFNGQDMGGMNGSGFSDFFESLFGNGRGGGGDPFASFGGGRRQTYRGRDLTAKITLPLEEVQKGCTRTFTVNADGRTRTLQVNIPAGIKDGGKLRLAGQGEAGPAGPGDVLVEVRYADHPLFKRDGRDLTCVVPVTPWDAVLGGTVRVPTLEGEVEIRLPAGSSSGRKMRLRGKGLGPAGQRGDLYAQVEISVPTQLTDEETELWRKLASVSKFRA